MKMLARSFVWWPQIDRELKDVVKACESCQCTRHLPPVAPLQPWEWPQKPWVRLHADYAEPFLGQMFLKLVHIDHILSRSPRIVTILPDDWMGIPDIPTKNEPPQPTVDTANTTSQLPLRRSTQLSVPPECYGQT